MQVLLAVLVAVAAVGANAASAKCAGADEALCYVREMLRQTMSEVDEALHRETDDNKEKRKSSLMRFGRSSVNEPDTEVEKRKSALIRLGRRNVNELDTEVKKRKSSFVRFGGLDRDGAPVKATDKIGEKKREAKGSFVHFG